MSFSESSYTHTKEGQTDHKCHSLSGLEKRISPGGAVATHQALGTMLARLGVLTRSSDKCGPESRVTLGT